MKRSVGNLVYKETNDNDKYINPDQCKLHKISSKHFMKNCMKNEPLKDYSNESNIAKPLDDIKKVPCILSKSALK